MKKGIILNLKQIKLLDYVAVNKIFILLSVVFISGIVIGTVRFDSGIFLTQNSEKLFESFTKLHTEYKLIARFFICLSRYIFILILYFISGASMLGVAITPFITLWQGIFTGSITSHLYSTYKLNGIAFNAIVLVPPLAVFAVCSFFAAKYAIDFSLSIAKLTLPRSRPVSLYNAFKTYCTKSLIFIAIAILCSAVEIILNILFLKFFNF
ncbi:MAG: hypothetical protein IKJ50_05235 [Clostridia bacterium]|nr:hypothetical protein [Clostridia bacterium]